MDISKIIQSDPEGIWVDFISGVRLKLKPATPTMLNRFQKQCTTKYFKRGRPIEELDNEKYVQLLSEAVVCGWEGIEKDGKAFPCTPENVKLLVNNWTEFNAFIQESATHLERYINEHEARAAKN